MHQRALIVYSFRCHCKLQSSIEGKITHTCTEHVGWYEDHRVHMWPNRVVVMTRRVRWRIRG